MNLRQALIDQAPSLALQRAAQAEIARLDAVLKRITNYAQQQTSANTDEAALWAQVASLTFDSEGGDPS